MVRNCKVLLAFTKRFPKRVLKPMLPLCNFSVYFSVDHTGVPNTQLVQEATAIAELYKGKSVAEQNSVDKSWELLMEPQFKDLRNAIYCNEAELTRFRSLLVNSVMATDIVDKQLKELRNARWDRACSGFFS